MRKHRIFGVVIAALLGTGALAQRPGAANTNNGTNSAAIELLSVRTSAAHDLSLPTVHTQGFMIRPASNAAGDSMLQLSTFMVPLPPVTPPPPPPPPPPPAPAPAPAPKPAVVQQQSAPAGDVWLELRQCESNDNYADNTGNGYYGAYQFSEATWQSLGYSGLPSDASPADQDAAAHTLQARSGWGQWPSCSRRLGLT